MANSYGASAVSQCQEMDLWNKTLWLPEGVSCCHGVILMKSLPFMLPSGLMEEREPWKLIPCLASTIEFLEETLDGWGSKIPNPTTQSFTYIQHRSICLYNRFFQPPGRVSCRVLLLPRPQSLACGSPYIVQHKLFLAASSWALLSSLPSMPLANGWAYGARWEGGWCRRLRCYVDRLNPVWGSALRGWQLFCLLKGTYSLYVYFYIFSVHSPGSLERGWSLSWDRAAQKITKVAGMSGT